MELYSFTARQLEDAATEVKNFVIDFLFDNEFLTEEQAIDLQRNHVILVRKLGFFRRILSGKEKDSLSYIMVQQRSLSEEAKDRSV